jgi:hypothetical protein
MRKNTLLAGVAFASLFVGHNAFADSRVVINTPNGQSACLLQGDAYVDCVSLDKLRVEIDTPNGKQSCLWLNDQYSDCVAVSGASAEAGSDSTQPMFVSREEAEQKAREEEEARKAQEEEARKAQEEAEMMARADELARQALENAKQAPEPSQPSVSYDVDYEYGYPNGFLYGVSFGWFGQVYDGKNDINSFSFGGNIGGKWDFVGFTLDLDASIGLIDTDSSAEYWTFTFSGLVSAYYPIDMFSALSLHFGVGYTGWSIDKSWTSRTLVHNWYYGYYIEEENYTENIDSGGFLSLKMKARIDLCADDWVIGLEFDWIPWIDPDKKNGSKIVNNIIGIQLYVGQIL